MSRKALPTPEQVWSRVCEFAQRCVDENLAIPTLQRRVLNHIVEVETAKIHRASAEGRTNKTPITRGELLRAWAKLSTEGHIDKPPTNYFTLALLQAALSDIVDDLGDGRIALRGVRPLPGSASDPKPRAPVFYDQRATEQRLERDRRAAAEDREPLRESDAHWRIKYFIRDHPDEALAKLDGGPWIACGVEIPLPLPTTDTVDVIVKSQADARRLLIEVKPSAPSAKRRFGLYAQAAKYRAIWRVLHDLEIDGVRCALAAPTIPRSLAGRMLERHAIESVAVKVPKGYRAPPRDD